MMSVSFISSLHCAPHPSRTPCHLPKKKRRFMSNNWTFSSKLCFLKEFPQFFHWWTSGQKTHLIRNGQRLDCIISNYVPFVVPGLSVSSSSTTPSPTSPSSSSQDSVFDVNRHTENPVPARSESASEELLGDPLHESTETKTKLKMVNHKKYKEMCRMNCMIGYRISERIWLMKVDRQSPGETKSGEVKTLPNHLMNYLWSREQKWIRVRVSTVSTRTFQRTQIVISAR